MKRTGAILCNPFLIRHNEKQRTFSNRVYSPARSGTPGSGLGGRHAALREDLAMYSRMMQGVPVLHTPLRNVNKT